MDSFPPKNQEIFANQCQLCIFYAVSALLPQRLRPPAGVAGGYAVYPPRPLCEKEPRTVFLEFI